MVVERRVGNSFSCGAGSCALPVPWAHLSTPILRAAQWNPHGGTTVERDMQRRVGNKADGGPLALLGAFGTLGLTVRHTRSNDIPEIVALSKEVYPWDPYSIHQVEAQIDAFADGHFVVHDHAGHVIGFSAAMRLSKEHGLDASSWGSITSEGTLACLLYTSRCV